MNSIPGWEFKATSGTPTYVSPDGKTLVGDHRETGLHAATL